MKSLKYLLLLLIVLLPISFVAAQSGEVKKAKTIDELVKMFDSSSCKVCHAEIYEQWEKSLHARSIYGPVTSGRTAATIKTTIELGLKEWEFSGVKKPEDVKVEHLMICAKCHLPQLKYATDDVAKEIVRNIYAFTEKGDEKAAETLEKLNINCLICHNEVAIVHKWTDGYPDKKAVYGSKSGAHPDPKYPSIKESKIMKESILCGQCHGLGPNFELDNPSQCATLYGSYLWSYVAEGGTETCQDCHIHKSKLGHNMQSYRSPEMAKMAVDLDVEVLPHYWRDGTKIIPQTSVEVRIKNKAGHTIPDG